MKPARIDLHIGELVLHDFPPASRTAIAAAVERALAAELAAPALQRALSRPARIDGLTTTPVRLARSTPPRAVGSAVARALAGALSARGGGR